VHGGDDSNAAANVPPPLRRYNAVVEPALGESQVSERTGARHPWLRTLLALLVAALLAGSYAGLTLRARAVRQSELHRFYHLPWELDEQLRALGPLTAAELSTKFNQPIRTQQHRGHTISWIELSSGHDVVVNFDANGRLSNARAIQSRAPRQSRLLLALEASHPLILTWTLPLWAVLLALAAIFRLLRRVTTQAALTVAALSLAAVLLYHGRSGRIIGVESYIILIPYYITQVGLVLISLLIVILTLLGRRRDPNDIHCPRCRYDLHGNQSGVCPECGLRIPPSIRWKIRTLGGGAAAPVAAAPPEEFIITDDPPEGNEPASVA
jgi:hypothetical protein